VTTFVNDYSFYLTNALVLSPGYPGRADNKSNNRATLSEPLKKATGTSTEKATLETLPSFYNFRNVTTALTIVQPRS